MIDASHRGCGETARGGGKAFGVRRHSEHGERGRQGRERERITNHLQIPPVDVGPGSCDLRFQPPDATSIRQACLKGSNVVGRSELRLDLLLKLTPTTLLMTLLVMRSL